jgi:Mrp family chromosome partitioning ATPase
VDVAWAALPALALDPRHLRRNRVVTAHRTDPAYGAFDVLRTRVLGEMERRGWRRLGITSPTKGCGKTFTAVNLAVTLSRLTDLRTLLLDLDLRRPAVARLLGAPRPGALGDVLRGLVPPARALARVGPNDLQVGRLALGLNGRPEPFAAELFRDPRAAAALAEAEAALAPDLTIFDLPPALAQDDVLALRPHYDALLIVAGGGQTTPRELKEVARRLGPDAPILGVVLNRAEGAEIEDYAYDYG